MSEQQSRKEPWRNLGDPLLNKGETYLVTTEEKGVAVQWVKHCVNCIPPEAAKAKYPGVQLREVSSICADHYPLINPPRVGE